MLCPPLPAAGDQLSPFRAFCIAHALGSPYSRQGCCISRLSQVQGEIFVKFNDTDDKCRKIVSVGQQTRFNCSLRGRRGFLAGGANTAALFAASRTVDWDLGGEQQRSRLRTKATAVAGPAAPQGSGSGELPRTCGHKARPGDDVFAARRSSVLSTSWAVGRRVRSPESASFRGSVSDVALRRRSGPRAPRLLQKPCKRGIES